MAAVTRITQNNGPGGTMEAQTSSRRMPGSRAEGRLDARVRGHDHHATSTVYVRSRVHNTLSGQARCKQPTTALAKGLKALDAGDTLITWKLDGLDRSRRDLIALLDDLKARRVKMGRKPKLSPQQVAYARKLLEQEKDRLALMYQAALT